MTKKSDLKKVFRAQRRFDRIEVAVKATAFFKDGTSTPCLVHDISANKTKNSFGMRVELIDYKCLNPPGEYYVYIEQGGQLIKYRPAWRQKL